MHHQQFEAPAELQDCIKCFWHNRLNSAEVQSGIEVQANAYTEIIFYIGSTCSISYNGQLHPLPSPFMMGLLNKPAYFYASNKLDIIGIRCFPWTVFNLPGLPSGKDGVLISGHPIASNGSKTIA